MRRVATSNRGRPAIPGGRLRAAAEGILAKIRVETDHIKLRGGLDEVTPPYDLKSGFVRISRNFEANTEGGYRRIAGYERFNGKPKPSDAIYSILNCTISGTISVGNTITGGTSAATAVVLAVVVGSPTYLVLTKITGVWVNAEDILVSAVDQGNTIGGTVANGATTPLLDATYRALAADSYRTDIAAPTGSGVILGVFEYLDTVYAFRNNAGGTAADLWKSSGSGWTAVALNEEIGFSNANTSVGEGDTLTQGAVTALIRRVVVQTGTLASGVNTGRLIISGRAGGNYGVGAATSTGGGALTLAAIQTAITLLPGGSYEFIIENFGGGTATKRVYGCDSVNRGFEFDGTVFVPIATGMATDTPSHVKGHKNHLFFSFLGSVQHSGPGTPYIWSAVLGAAELAMGDTVSGFAAQPGSSAGGALAIYTRNRTSILYGTGVANWNLAGYRDELGAYPKTIQDVGFTFFLDDRGITSFQTSQDYGNFAHATVTDRVRNSMNAFRLAAIASCISRDRNQYRIFFSSGAGYYITLTGSNVIGIMPTLFPNVVRCVWSGERINGEEAIYFGSDSGHVYQMEKGTSHDGTAIEFFFNMAYNFQKMPRSNKRYYDLTVEINSLGYTSFNLGYKLGYNSPDIPQPSDTPIVASFSQVFWDTFIWDAFYWDGTTLGPSSVDLDGEAENISLSIQGNSGIYEPFNLTAFLLHFSHRGRLRP